jgi:hypothetical protein
MKKILIILTVIFASVVSFSQTKDTANYVLVGKLSDFQLLFKYVTTPDDVTKNEARALAAWIQKIAALPPKENNSQNKAKQK